MNPNDLIFQRPQGTPQQLILLFHGVGSRAEAMRALGERLASAFPQAAVVAVQGPHPTEPPGHGWQWFSVKGITDANRGERVAAVLPGFVAQIEGWQQETGVNASATALVGFSQGAILSLEASKLTPAPAGRVVAIGGRFASLPEHNLPNTTVHFLHGKLDAVIPYANTVMAAHHLRDLGADITAEVLPFVGHAIHPEFIDMAVDKLATHIPNRVWTRAIQEGALDGTL